MKREIKHPGTVQSVDRAVAILFALAAAKRSMALGEISETVTLDKATAHRLLKTLAAHNLVTLVKGLGRYSLGWGVQALSSRMAGGVNLKELARPFLESLSQRTEETTALGILVDDHHMFIDTVEGTQMVRCNIPIGLSHSLRAGAAPRAILAFLPEEDRERIITDLDFPPVDGADQNENADLFVPNPPRDADDLRRRICDAQRLGCAMAFGERSGDIAAIAAPIFDSTGRAFGELTICGPKVRFTQGRMLDAQAPLLEAAAKLSGALGFRPALGWETRDRVLLQV